MIDLQKVAAEIQQQAIDPQQIAAELNHFFDRPERRKVANADLEAELAELIGF